MTQPTLEQIVCSAGPDAFRMAYWQWGDAQAGHVVVCVHGLTREGRDFDELAQVLLRDAAARGEALRIVCPDVPGRGYSEWLQDPQRYQVPVYAQGMLALLAQLQRQAPIRALDWVGTSMGGLIGLALASLQGTATWPQGVPPMRRMVLNDVGPAVSFAAIERIGSYVTDTGHFADEAAALHALRERFAGFGPHTDAQWAALNQAMLRPHAQGGWRMHYDPRIGLAFRSLDQSAWTAGENLLWKIYDAMTMPVLLLRGAQSDLLTHEAAVAMTERGPRAQLIEFAGVGHTPTLVAPDQTAAVSRFLLADAGR